MSTNGTIQVHCTNCGLTDAWTFHGIIQEMAHWECATCGDLGRSSVRGLVQPRRILYLDQFALSFMVKEKDENWIKLREVLLLLSSRQFWLCPIFQEHYNDISLLSKENADTHYNLIQRLANGRSFKEPALIKKQQIKDAYLAYKSGLKSWPRNRELAYLFFSPTEIMPPFAPVFTKSLPKLRTDREDSYRQRAREGYRELIHSWADNPLPKAESRQLEHNFLVEAHLDMLLLMTSGVINKDSALLKSGMFEIYLNSIGSVIADLLAASEDKEKGAATIAAFLQSGHFGTVPHLEISSILHSFLRKDAQDSVSQATNLERYHERRDGDMNDVEFISLVLPYVTDMLIDLKFERFLNQPEMNTHSSNTRIWTSRSVPQLLAEATTAINSAKFRVHDEFFRRLAPYDKNPFALDSFNGNILYRDQIIETEDEHSSN